MLLSMKLHIQYLRSLEESERVRKACLAYLQNWFICFYPGDADIIDQLQSMAAEFEGHLELPHLGPKYAWIRPLLGWRAANWAQRVLPETKDSLLKRWDKAMFEFETRQASQ